VCVVVHRRIVEGGIDRPELRNGRLDGRPEVIVVGQIALYRRRGTSGCSDGVGSLLQHRRRVPDYGNFCSLPGRYACRS